MEPISGDRDAYDNLILMCPTHHALIDSAVQDYPVIELHRMKDEHQAWVRDSLGVDRSQLDLDVRWARVVDQFDGRIGLDKWHLTIGSLIYDVDPILSKSLVKELRELCRWIEVRPWPSGHESIKKALVGFARVMNELLDMFMQEAEAFGDGGNLKYPRWYKINNWDPELYDRLLAEYRQARRLITDLVYEATRHLNWLMESVRASVDPDYREEEGYVYLLSDGSDDGESTLVPRFSEIDLADGAPYTTRARFLEVRESRRVHA